MAKQRAPRKSAPNPKAVAKFKARRQPKNQSQAAQSSDAPRPTPRSPSVSSRSDGNHVKKKKKTKAPLLRRDTEDCATRKLETRLGKKGNWQNLVNGEGLSVTQFTMKKMRSKRKQNKAGNKAGKLASSFWSSLYAEFPTLQSSALTAELPRPQGEPCADLLDACPVAKTIQ